MEFIIVRDEFSDDEEREPTPKPALGSLKPLDFKSPEQSVSGTNITDSEVIISPADTVPVSAALWL